MADRDSRPRSDHGHTAEVIVEQLNKSKEGLQRGLNAIRDSTGRGLTALRDSEVIQRVGRPLEHVKDLAQAELQRVEAKLESKLREKFGGLDTSETAESKLLRTHERYKALFNLLDDQERGAVPIDELEELFGAARLYEARTEVGQLAYEADLDGNGALDFEEFSSVLDKLSEYHHNLVLAGKVAPVAGSFMFGTEGASLTLKQVIYSTFDDPTFSKLSRIVAGLLFFAIILAVAVFMAQSVTALAPYGGLFGALEGFSSVVFTVDYVARLLTCPSKKAFLLSWGASIDLLTIVPYYLDEYMTLFQPNGGGGATLRVLRVLRVLRILRASKYVPYVGLMSRAASAALTPLCMSMTVMMIGSLLLAFSILYAERGEWDPQFGDYVTDPITGAHSAFTDVGAALYWVIITVSTVGYGDLVPLSGWGKVVGTVTALAGCVIVSFPVSIYTEAFSKEYAEFTKTRGLQEELGYEELVTRLEVARAAQLGATPLHRFPAKVDYSTVRCPAVPRNLALLRWGREGEELGGGTRGAGAAAATAAGAVAGAASSPMGAAAVAAASHHQPCDTPPAPATTDSPVIPVLPFIATSTIGRVSSTERDDGGAAALQAAASMSGTETTDETFSAVWQLALPRASGLLLPSDQRQRSWSEEGRRTHGAGTYVAVEEGGPAPEEGGPAQKVRDPEQLETHWRLFQRHKNSAYNPLLEEGGGGDRGASPLPPVGAAAPPSVRELVAAARAREIAPKHQFTPSLGGVEVGPSGGGTVAGGPGGPLMVAGPPTPRAPVAPLPTAPPQSRTPAASATTAPAATPHPCPSVPDPAPRDLVLTAESFASADLLDDPVVRGAILHLISDHRKRIWMEVRKLESKFRDDLCVEVARRWQHWMGMRPEFVGDIAEDYVFRKREMRAGMGFRRSRLDVGFIGPQYGELVSREEARERGARMQRYANRHRRGSHPPPPRARAVQRRRAARDAVSAGPAAMTRSEAIGPGPRLRRNTSGINIDLGTEVGGGGGDPGSGDAERGEAGGGVPAAQPPSPPSARGALRDLFTSSHGALASTPGGVQAVPYFFERVLRPALATLPAAAAELGREALDKGRLAVESALDRGRDALGDAKEAVLSGQLRLPGLGGHASGDDEEEDEEEEGERVRLHTAAASGGPSSSRGATAPRAGSAGRSYQERLAKEYGGVLGGGNVARITKGIRSEAGRPLQNPYQQSGGQGRGGEGEGVGGGARGRGRQQQQEADRLAGRATHEWVSTAFGVSLLPVGLPSVSSSLREGTASVEGAGSEIPRSAIEYIARASLEKAETPGPATAGVVAAAVSPAARDLPGAAAAVTGAAAEVLPGQG